MGIIELSAKVTKLCVEYSRAVKNAQKDIARLQDEVVTLQEVFTESRKIIETAENTEISALSGGLQSLEVKDKNKSLASSKVLQSLQSCSSQLMKLHERLATKKRTRLVGKIGLRELQWPFESKEVDEIIQQLQRHKQTVSLAFQIDQVKLLRDIRSANVWAALPIADGAAFDSYTDQLDARCHPETRVDLRRQIKEWASEPPKECLFWLNGMAGTGKSAIARTIAQEFAQENRLGGSFFSKGARETVGTRLDCLQQLLASLRAMSRHLVRSCMEQSRPIPISLADH